MLFDLMAIIPYLLRSLGKLGFNEKSSFLRNQAFIENNELDTGFRQCDKSRSSLEFAPVISTVFGLSTARKILSLLHMVDRVGENFHGSAVPFRQLRGVGAGAHNSMKRNYTRKPGMG